MAESQHTLHLVAKLDTTDVQAKLRQLNASGSITSPSSSAAGQSHDITSGAVGGLIARQLQNSANQTTRALTAALKPLSSASAQLTRQMNHAMSSMSVQMNRMQRQMLTQVNAMQMAQAQIAKLARADGHHQTKRTYLDYSASAEEAQLLADLGLPVPKNAAQFFSSRAGGKRLGGKNPLLNLSVGPGGKGTYNYITPFAAPSFTPALMTANSQAALPDNNPANMQRRKGMIAKAGLAYAMTSILPSAANLVGAYGHSKLEYLMTAFGRIGEDAAKGAGIGLAVGAASSGGAGAMPGAVVGGLAGGIVSGIKEIIDVLALFKKNAKAAADSLKRVSDADRAAISTTLVALREANRISSISGMTREQASAAYDTAAKHVALIQQDIAGGEFGNAAGLQSLLSEQAVHQDRMSAAQARLNELQSERQRRAAAAEAAAAAARARQAALDSLHTSASDAMLGMDQAALSRGNALKLAGMTADGNVDMTWLRAGWKKHGAEAAKWRDSARYHLAMAGEADTPELAARMMSEASRHQSRASFSLSQSDFFKSGLLAALQDQLSRLAAPDMSHVTSLGQYGYGMGEKNDNIERQMQIWEEQAQLQRDIRDILTDKTFEAAYSD